MKPDSPLMQLNEPNINLTRNVLNRKTCNNKIKYILLLLLFCLIIPCIIIMKEKIKLRKLNCPYCHIPEKNILDGCQYVYIDMGTNIGIQIRKLYEPHLYPKAPVLPYFKDVFGDHLNEVCSIGFEANPLHDKYLKEFENYCLKRFWRVKIFTSTAVSITKKNLTFYLEPGNEANNQWGASLEAGNKKESITVPSIDIISWFKKTVLQRKLSHDSPTKIMMKSDIEGHDTTVLANLVLSGVYCSIDFIFGEHITKELQDSISLLQKYSDSCKTKLVYLDDESYYNQRFPFNLNNSTK